MNELVEFPLLVDAVTPQHQIIGALESLGWRATKASIRGHDQIFFRTWTTPDDAVVTYMELHHLGLRALALTGGDANLVGRLLALPFVEPVELLIEQLDHATEPRVLIRAMGVIELLAPAPRYKNELLRIVERLREHEHVLVRRALYQSLFVVARQDLAKTIQPMLNSNDQQLGQLISWLNERYDALDEQ